MATASNNAFKTLPGWQYGIDEIIFFEDPRRGLCNLAPPLGLRLKRSVPRVGGVRSAITFEELDKVSLVTPRNCSECC